MKWVIKLHRGRDGRVRRLLRRLRRTESERDFERFLLTLDLLSR